jgi:hypothetical protein
MSTDEATEVGADRRWAAAAWWGGLVLVAGVVVGRVTGSTVVLVLAVLATAAVGVAVVRTRPAVVSREEVRLPKRTIRRADVARITRAPEDSTALVFLDRDGKVVGLADLFDASGAFREALRRHGWPEVDAPA